MSLTVVSLFDGIGGFCLGFERAGAEVVATVEIDQAAAAVSGRHFPAAAQFDDVTKVTGDDLRSVGFVPERGIVTAGWPCQDFSVAGRRAGLGGARSGLWWEVVRILAETRPRWFLGENVPGLLSSVCQCTGLGECSSNERTGECLWEPHPVDGGACRGGCMESHGGAMGSVLGSLGELGYGIAYRVLDAQHFGVPQQRRRVFIVGHLGEPFGAAAQVLLEPEGGGGDSSEGSSSGSRVAAVASESVAGLGEQRLDTHTHNDAAGGRQAGIPDRRRSGSGWPSGRREVVGAMTTSYCGGIGGVDDNAAQAGYVVAQPLAVHENQRGEITTPDVMGTLKAGGGKPGQGYPCVVQPLAVRGREGGAMLEAGEPGAPYNALRAGDGGSSRQSLIAVTSLAVAGDFSTGDDVAQTIRAAHGQPGVVSLDMRNAARASGNGVGTQGDGIREGGPSYSVTALERNVPAIGTETVVRRLTELECERLQGYPDGWTAHSLKDLSEVIVPWRFVCALFPTAVDDTPPTGYASCITSDFDGMTVSIYRPAVATCSTPAASVTGWLEMAAGEHAECAEVTTNRGSDMAIRCRPSETPQRADSAQLGDAATIGPSLLLNLVGPCDPARLSTISTWMRATTTLGISTSAQTPPSMDAFTVRWNSLPPNYFGGDCFALRVASTAPASASARYRQLGNSVAVPVIEWIARRLVDVDEGLR